MNPTLSRRPLSFPFIVRLLGILTLAVSLLEQSAHATDEVWKNGNSDFNKKGAWTPSGVPGPTDTADFDSAMVVQPNMSASVTIQELTFSTASSSGYDLTSSNTGIKLTLTSATAINAANTSGTNTIDAPIVLSAAANSTQNFTQAIGGSLIVNGVISNTNNVTLSLAGGGIIQLGGANTYTGGTTLTAGTLNINNANALGTGTFTIASGSNAIIDNTTAGAITLSTNNTQIWNGDFTFTGTQSLNLGTGAVTLGGNRTVTVNTNNLTVGGVISGGGFSVTKAGAGTLTLAGANTYSGGTTVSAGSLQLSGSGTLGSTNGGLTVNGGTLNLNGTNQGVGNLTGSGGTILNNATGTNVSLTIGNNNSTGGNYSGVIANHTSGTGTVALTKTGTGTITLSGTNTYTGATTVNAGTLLINGNNSAATGAVSVNNSGTTLGGTGTIGGAVTVGSGAKLLGGTGSAASGTLTLANNLTLNSGSIIELALGTSGAHSSLARTGGTWSFNATQAFTFINLGAQPGSYSNIITGLGSDPGSESGWTITNIGWIGNFTYGSGDISLNVVAVPEPATYIAGVLTLAAILLHQRRRWRCLLRGPVTGYL
ncbi:MAG: autotransporter-associated beta strand repeat-containing protein [Chthoniobacterales bacterium]